MMAIEYVGYVSAVAALRRAVSRHHNSNGLSGRRASAGSARLTGGMSARFRNDQSLNMPVREEGLLTLTLEQGQERLFRDQCFVAFIRAD